MRIDFVSSAGPTLGVEVELQVIDPVTRDLTSDGGRRLLARLSAPHGPSGHPKVKPEFYAPTVEAITGICDSVAQARADLAGTITEISQAAQAEGVALACAGVHPFALWSEQTISPDARYRALLDEMRWTAERLLIYGIHVHVGIRSPEKCIRIANALAGYIPHLLALSASSPYLQGHDTGLASSRSKIFEALPTSGLPARFADWAGFESFMDTMVASGAISTVREVWWDIRPHPGFGTIEVRVCDGIPRLDDIASIAALVQSLVVWLDSLDDRGYRLPVHRHWVLRHNKWKAARYGLDGPIITDTLGTLRPIRSAVEDMLEELAPTARRLHCSDELGAVHDILARGPSYLRQRAMVQQGASLADVVDALSAELTASL